MGHGNRGGRGTCLVGRGRDAHEDVVEPPVVVALELDDLPPAGVGAGEAERRLHRLAPRGREAHQLRAGHDLGEAPGEGELELMLAGEELSHRQRAGHRFQHRRRRVAEDRGAVGERVVDVDVTVDVGEARARSSRVEQGHRALPVAGVAEVAADPAPEVLLRLLVERCGIRVVHRRLLSFLPCSGLRQEAE